MIFWFFMLHNQALVSDNKHKKIARKERTAESSEIATLWVGSGGCVPFRHPEPTRGNRNKARL